MAAKKVVARLQHRRGLLNDLAGVILNSGEFGLAQDERRVFIGNRTTESGPIDENIEILTQYSTIEAASITLTLTNVAFTTLGTDTTFLTFDTASKNVFFIRYTMSQNSVIRTGIFRIVSDGTIVTFDDDFIEVGGSTTVTLSATMSGAFVNIQYNATANPADFNYSVDSFLQ